MTRRFGDWLRTAWEGFRRRGTRHRDEFGEPWMRAAPDPSPPVADHEEPGLRPVARLVVADPPAADAVMAEARVADPPVADLPVPVVDPPVADRDAALVGALHRVADSFERVADGLEADRRDRRARLDDVDVLLRELVTGLGHPSAAPPVVLGGSIEPDASGERAVLEGQLDLTRPEITADVRTPSS